MFIAIAVLFGAVFAVSPAVRAAVIRFVRSWRSDYIKYEKGSGSFDFTRGEWIIGYVPEGYEPVVSLR